MQVLFSAVERGDEKLTDMVGEDIRAAIKEGKAEDDKNKLSYEHTGNGIVAITDKETGEVTMAEKDPEGSEDDFNLWQPDEQIEGFAHPEGDGVTPGQQEGAPDEHVEEHVEGGSVAGQPQPASVEEKAEGEEVCPECGKNPCECEEHEEGEEEKEFSTTNTAFQKVFSKQLLVEGLYSEVIESEETTTVGDLKFEKVPGEDAIVVTDKKTGHQVKVAMDDENLNVVELESKSFGEEEGAPTGGDADHQESIGFWVIGLDADNHQLVESNESEQEAAEEAAHRFEENGMIGVQIFEVKEEAEDYARGLLEHLGADEVAEEIEEKEFSDGAHFYARSFSTTHSNLMYRMFSEHVADAEACEEDECKIKDALKEGEEVKIEGDVIIPIREDLGLIHDTENDEYTKVEVEEDGDLSYQKVDEEDAEKLKEEAFSQVYTNEAETRFFSENEVLTSYMERLFSEEADEEAIADAIESGEQVEHEKEIITPIDEKTAVIEDKETGEFTKATLEGEDEDEINVEAISEEEADELTKDIEVEEEEHKEDEEEEKEFSVYSDEAETRFFSENEVLTSYMERLFSEEADEEEIAKAIESGDTIDGEKEVITPIDENVAIIEDKENGEFTKATLEGEDKEEIEVEPIEEEEAKKLLGEVKEEDEEEEKKFSTLNKFFAEVASAAPAEGKTVQEVTLEPGQSVVIVDEDGNPVQPAEEDEAPASVEVIEDKALAAVQSIQEAAAAAEQAIQQAKAAPAENAEAPLQEAQFSQKNYSEINADPLLTWLKGNKIG